MLINKDKVRNYDMGLFITTLCAVILLLVIAFNFSTEQTHDPRFSQLSYIKQGAQKLDFHTVSRIPDERWKFVTAPVNLGMDTEVYWFKFNIAPMKDIDSDYLLQIDYALIDKLSIALYDSLGSTPRVIYHAGDSIEFGERPINYITPLVPLLSNELDQQVVLRVETSGTIRLPIKVWEENEFIEHASRRDMVMGLFFGFICAMGISNLFLFLTTKRRSFLYYSGYVFSLGLTLAALHGYGYAFVWKDLIWFESIAIALFANATIFFASIFTRHLLPIRQHSRLLDTLLKGVGWYFGLSLVLCFILPYELLIKIFLLAMCVTVTYIIGLGAWLSMKGVAVARYFSVAWGCLLISALVASFDNMNIVQLGISANNMLIIGGAVEAVILASILAISYSHSRDDLIYAQQFALEKEKQANSAKEDLLAVQQRYQEDLEYKVQERTLELEITLRELSDVNRELEQLTSVDPLTGINNRRHFDKRLKSEGRRSRREQTPLSLIMIDIDHFKQINDTHGHTGGDACLIHVTKLLKEALHRPTDDLCRIGGEEFAIILPNTDSEGAQHVARTIREQVERTPSQVDEHCVSLTISAGVATAIIERDEQTHELIRLADEKLYAAKAGGRNQICY